MIAKTVRNAALGTLLAGSMTALAVIPAHAQDDRVVAEVNGEEIMLSEVEAAMASLPPQAQQIPREMLIPMMADQVATGRLIAERGYAAGLDESDEVRERLRQAEERIVQEVWLDQEMQARLTDEVMEEAYETMMLANPPAEEISARHILLDTEDEAREAIGRLDAGEDFAALAEELSTGPTASRGGDLGWFAQGDMIPAFSDAAFAMDVGTYSEEPVQSQFGWHVIQLEDRRTPEAPALDEVRGEVEQRAMQTLIEDLIAELQADAEIVIYDADGNPIDPDAGIGPGAAPIP